MNTPLCSVSIGGPGMESILPLEPPKLLHVATEGVPPIFTPGRGKNCVVPKVKKVVPEGEAYNHEKLASIVPKEICNVTANPNKTKEAHESCVNPECLVKSHTDSV